MERNRNQSQKCYGSHNHNSKFKPYWLELVTLSRNITKWSTIYITIASILLFPVLMKPYELYISGYAQHGDTFINFTGDELNAAKWIEKNTPRDYLVFSDPFTVIEMKGLAFRQNIPAIGWNITVAKLVKSAMTAEDASNAYDKIVSNFGKKIIIIITPRTTEWLKTNNLNLKINPDTYFVMFPIDKFQGFGGFDNFFNKKYFKLEYKSRNTFVFALNGNDHVNSVRANSNPSDNIQLSKTSYLLHFNYKNFCMYNK